MYLFYEFKSCKQKTVPGLSISHYFGENLCSFIILYRSPSQTHDNFGNFMKNFELNHDEIN